MNRQSLPREGSFQWVATWTGLCDGAGTPFSRADRQVPATEAMMPEPFEQFVDDLYVAAYRFALSLCGHEADASDLTQQAFLLAQAKFHQVRDAAKQKSWLFTILAREFYHTRRKRAQYEHHSLELVEAELPRITVDHAARIDARSVHATLLNLEEHFRVPLSLFYFEQLSYREIAEIIEVPIGTVMSRLARGKEMLRQSLEQMRSGPQDIPLHKITGIAGETRN